MWFLATVYSHVHGQGRALYESLATAGIVALMWFFVGVDFFCGHISLGLGHSIPANVPCLARSLLLAKLLLQVLRLQV